MANVVIFVDSTPRNINTNTNPIFFNYISKSAGAYAIASNLRRQGFSVQVVEHCSLYTLAGIKKIINDNRSDLLWVGLNTTFFTLNENLLKNYRIEWENSKELFFHNKLVDSGQMFITSDNLVNTNISLIWHSEQINLIARECKVPFLIGGAQVSHVVNGGLKNLEKNVFVIKGRAELVTEHITKNLASGNKSDLNIFLDNDYYDNVSFKESQFIWDSNDNIDSDDWLPLEIARGCAFNCAYCNYDRKSNFDNYKNPKILYNELVKNFNDFGVTKYILMDDLYNDSKDKVRILYDQVWSKLPFKVEWTSYLRLDMFWSDNESIEIIKNSGARMGSFGIETLHNIAGRKVGKGLGKERILETLTKLKKSWKDDVLIDGLFIVGLPDEPEDSIVKTINWATQTDLLDTCHFTALYVVPPANKQFVLKPSNITNDNDRYQIKWLDESNWINNTGMTFKHATELAAMANNRRKSYMRGFGDYPEYRRLGWTHQDIVELKTNAEKFLHRLKSDSAILNPYLISKIKKTLK